MQAQTPLSLLDKAYPSQKFSDFLAVLLGMHLKGWCVTGCGVLLGSRLKMWKAKKESLAKIFLRS